MANLVKENINISLRAIKGQLLRTILTVVIIAFGITSLVGTLTAIDALKASINSNFTSMGANTFTIRNREMSIRIGKQGKRPKKYRSITYDEAIEFKNQFSFPALPSVSTMASGDATVKYESKKSNPNIRVFGGDENYLATSGYDLRGGRNFSVQEVQYGSHVAIIGQEVADAIFPKNINPVDKIISIGSGKYRIIGLLKSKGNSAGFGGDKICILPVNNVRQYFSRPEMTFTINVMCNDPLLMDVAVGEATGTFRTIRKVERGEEENFEITKSDNLASLLIDNLGKVTMGATIIGVITLLGAAIGLMNIMLVSVSERTREIGIRKAVGATQKIIRSQFLVEALVICQLGGLAGTILGILIGNIIALALQASFIVPWNWILLSIGLCFIVGTLSGIYPAIKASKLDPIEALRFE
jgi:putative ABC transport system permease protein